MLATGNQHRAIAIGLALGPLAGAAFYALRIIWPKSWNVAGFDSAWVMNPRYESELEQIEAMALSYAESISSNSGLLNVAGTAMRKTWWCLLATPTIVLIALGLNAVLA